jgi:hypothetical protein
MEEPEPEEPKSEEPSPKKKEGDVLSEAQNTRDDLKKQLDRREELIKREEQLIAQQVLRGKADAGSLPEKPKEETPQEYKDRVMRGDIK